MSLHPLNAAYGPPYQTPAVPDELTAIRQRVERLEAALRPFADLLPGPLGDVGGGTLVSPSIKVQWIKDAREALNP